MNNKTNSYLILASFSIFSLLSCKKDTFFNLTSEISLETIALAMEEGNSAIANIILTEELSEDFPIKLSVVIDEIPNYINEDDYGTFEYSNDLGKTWTRAINQTVIFQQRNRNLKVRITAIDDDKIEFHEAFDLVFDPQTTADFDLSGMLEPLHIEVMDNEVTDPTKVFPENLQYIEGALYEVDDDYNFNLIALNRDELYDANHKSMIDNGLGPKLIEDITRLTQTGEILIRRFEAIYKKSGLGGYVYNEGYNTDEWVLGMNLFHAYHAYEETGTIPIPYNSNGEFGLILAHEYGHILTLNQKKETNGDYQGACETLFLSEGCFHNHSILNQFNDYFYDPMTMESFNSPTHVSDYAETNIAEDIAETFAWYVAQEGIVPLHTESSGALQKLHFTANHPHLTGIKNNIQQTGVNIKIGTFGSPVNQKTFNLTTEGKRISCLDHIGIIKAMREKKFIQH